MAATITAPTPVTGDTTFGPVTLSFADGVAVADEVSPGLHRYLESAGFTVDVPKPTRRRTPKKDGEEGETNGD